MSARGLSELPGGRAPRSPAQEMRSVFADFGEVLMPEESDSPILAPGPRAVLHEWLTELLAADELQKAGLKPRKKALLFGPPGTGKTTLAHHLAARIGLPMVSVRSESIIDKYLGSTGQNIGRLFDGITRVKGQVVLFLDEFDALGSKRQSDSGASQERANSLNVLLRRLESAQCVTFAATNLQDNLDKAIWRRFDMQISVDLPGEDERWSIIKRYAADLNVPEADLDVLALATDGASPAMLRHLMESVRRSLILWPRLNRDVSDARAVIEAAVTSHAAPPGVTPPPLWDDPLAYSARLQWGWA